MGALVPPDPLRAVFVPEGHLVVGRRLRHTPCFRSCSETVPVRTLLKLVIAGLIVHGAWRAGSARWVHFEFEERLRETAQFAVGSTEDELRIRALEIAANLQVPLSPDALRIRRDQNHVFIDATYTTDIEILPRYRYPWEFVVHVDAWSIALR